MVANANANPNDDLAGISSLELSKYSGPNENDQWNDNCVGGNTTLHFQTSAGQTDGSVVGGSGITNGLYVSYNIPSFSELWLSGTDHVSPLPIVLGKFDAECNNGKVNLTWNTISEVNNDKFIIERSENGVDFSSLGKVQGAGNSNSLLHYKWVDTNPIRGMAYYRLKQVDYNGDNETFTAQSIYCKELVNPFRVYPNPAFDIIHIEFTSNKTNLNSRIELVDISGRIIYTESIKTDQGLNTYTLNNIEFNPGIYFIRVHLNAGEILTEKIVLSK